MSKIIKEAELRQNFKYLLLQNPNHFGNLSDLKLKYLPKPMQNIVASKSFEELTCLGYNPDTDILTAVVEIKKEAGYSGGPCTDGSQEYIRFYADYGDGVWVDHGLASFNIHDLDFDDDLCYAASIELNAKKRSCCDKDPVLPTIRAILSWNVEPPAGMPNWQPVWGNRIERDIQVDPRSSWWCNILGPIDFSDVQKLNPALVSKLKSVLDTAGPAPKPMANIPHLLEKVKGGEKEMLPLRQAFPMVAKLAQDKTDFAAFEALKGLKLDLSKFSDFILKPSFNTTYEELHCVGLDRDRDLLHGIVEIKRPSGFSGDLCHQGSREYIAFYLDFGSGWEYQGTTFVNVHDIQQTPQGGLWYQAALPVNLEPHKKEWCITGKARIRGILSWAVQPPINQPNFIPHWGNRKDCAIEIRHLPKGIPSGQLTSYLDAIGNISVDKVDGAGYATGESIGGAYTASDSPFGGTILLAGGIAFPTSNNLEYRVMVKGPDDPVAKAYTTTFDADVTTIVGGSITYSVVEQVAVDGWFNYIPQQGPTTFKSVAGNLLASFTTTKEGLHEVYLQVREAGTLAILTTGATEHYFVDNGRPEMDVEITSGAGNCSKFAIGEVLVGTFSMSDDLNHCDKLSISITPSPEASGGTLLITSAIPAPFGTSFPISSGGPSASMSINAGSLDTTGVSSGTWELDTTGMDPCGYNIRIVGEDRTIVNSGYIGWPGSDIEGFCLE
jgi:hypothetical protein